jgi:general secretion pathway protein K
VQQFAQILTALGVKVHPDYMVAKSDDRGVFSDKSKTFTIKATGVSGNVKKDLELVVTFDNRAGPLAQDMGRIIHWRER